jgi:hypothetical protein
MKLVEVVDKRNCVYLLPVGDIHFGSFNSEIEKVKDFVKWAKQENAYVFLMGDIFDVATLESQTSPFSQAMTLNEAIELAYEIFKPIKKQIIGAIIGNHEIRLMKYAGFDIMQNFCRILEINYCGYSAVIRFRVGRKNRKKEGYESPKIEYVFYAHHTTAGGNTIGGKINRIEKLRQIFEGADCYLGGHNHFEGCGKVVVGYLSKSGNGKAIIKYKKIYFVDTGSFLNYDNSYAEEKMLMPATIGCPRIRMDGIKKDLHISE